MKKLKLTTKQIYKMLEILNVDYINVKEIYQPTDECLLVDFTDGYRMVINIFKQKSYARKK